MSFSSGRMRGWARGGKPNKKPCPPYVSYCKECGNESRYFANDHVVLRYWVCDVCDAKNYSEVEEYQESGKDEGVER